MTPFALNDGQTLPRMGFGLWQVPDAEAPRVVAEAVSLGYRLADGAALYGNERGLGDGLRRAGMARDEVVVTTKVWNDRHGLDATLRSAEDSLRRLSVDRIDLLLIHWPAPARGLYVETWRALIRLREEGRVRSIGVSNFLPEHLRRIMGETGVAPVLNQVELHPELPQDELRAFHAEHGIVTQSWTPLGQSRTFGHPIIRGICGRTGGTPAQVVLAWHLALGCCPIPRSTNRERLAENLAALDLALEPGDLDAMRALGTGHRTGPDPMTFS